ncbi:antizyme inhibitor 2 [Trichonephila inaurata madagascariensis]|uniref:Antizyme inhibitor 2 n=1 Tax=Trichonephila inaurata madagascariensis TaxID=2747483 RepID=A0A8X6KPB2_9ARAC|nr:antizyme inhibitor 2 [Trichonephila inaurata madagascariensis]
MNGVNDSLKNSTNFKNVLDFISSKGSHKSYGSVYDFLTETGKQLPQDQAFFMFDLADILWKTQLWYEKLPNVAPYYAVKANADPVLMKLFVLLGYGFDCSTEGEIRLALKSGADPRKIIFAHTIKTHKALEYASSVGVDFMTFDTKEELLKISKDFPTARLVLRLKAESTQEFYNLSKKFGCELYEAEDLLLQAKNLNLNVVGVSFHVGALIECSEIYTSAIEKSRQVFDTAQKLGFKFTIMDIGAGFFGSTEKEHVFHKVSQDIKRSLKENFPNGDVEFIAEPGCYCVASAVSLTTSILGKKSVNSKETNQISREYFVNDSYYGSFFEHHDLYDVKPVPVLNPYELKERTKYKSKIWGQTCCSEDVAKEECVLPDMEEGEFIQWLNMGAYARGVASNFTIVPYPVHKHVFIHNPRLKLNNIPNLSEVMEYISQVSVLIKQNGEENKLMPIRE